MAQPSKAAKSLSIFGSIFVHLFSLTIAWVLKVVTQPALSCLSFHLYFGVSDCIPSPFRQCITTLSPIATFLTPSPTSKTSAQPSWPIKWGKNESYPLAPTISPNWEPHIPLVINLTRTWPYINSWGSSILSITKFLFCLTRIAALTSLGLFLIIQNK